MISELTDLPSGVIGFQATGELQAEDYRSVLLPAVERAAGDGDVRVVMVIREFDGVSAGAMWEDLKMGVEHFAGWRRIALVTDVDWMRHMTTMFGWMMPGEIKHFALDEQESAVAWAAG